MDDGACSSSQLQHLLQLSISDNPEDQQKAAVDLAKLVNGSVFPAYSYGPLSHALCKLIPSHNRTVASYSARALKMLVLDDALRPLTVGAGIPAVVCSAVQTWEDEILCLRELLGALQTLTWDKQCVKSVLQNNIISNLIDFAKEVSCYSEWCVFASGIDLWIKSSPKSSSIHYYYAGTYTLLPFPSIQNYCSLQTKKCQCCRLPR